RVSFIPVCKGKEAIITSGWADFPRPSPYLVNYRYGLPRDAKCG
ncbi:unnamed protein product, partial [marine sediment metagenome]